MKVIGFTASPYRLGQGYLYQGENALFTDIAYEISVQRSSMKATFSPDQLCPRAHQADLAQRSHHRGRIQYGGHGGGVRPPDRAGRRRRLTKTQYRGSIIVFCPRVDTCEKMRDALAQRGLHSAYVVTGETPAEQRDTLLRDFKEEKIRCLLSVSVLSTGFDAPSVDCIVLFRATTSPSLSYQMLGRGMRLHPSRQTALYSISVVTSVAMELSPTSRHQLREEKK